MYEPEYFGDITLEYFQMYPSWLLELAKEQVLAMAGRNLFFLGSVSVNTI